MLTNEVSGRPYHQVVFGASNIVGDPGYAIDGAFEKICSIEKNEDTEIHMVSQMALERMATDDEVELVRDFLIPNPDKQANYNTSYWTKETLPTCLVKILWLKCQNINLIL